MVGYEDAKSHCNDNTFRNYNTNNNNDNNGSDKNSNSKYNNRNHANNTSDSRVEMRICQA